MYTQKVHDVMLGNALNFAYAPTGSPYKTAYGTVNMVDPYATNCPRGYTLRRGKCTYLWQQHRLELIS